MPGAWDFVMKQLLEKNTQQFVSWLVEDGQFVETLSVELKRRDIYADALYKISLYGEVDTLAHRISESGSSSYG